MLVLGPFLDDFTRRLLLASQHATPIFLLFLLCLSITNSRANKREHCISRLQEMLDLQIWASDGCCASRRSNWKTNRNAAGEERGPETREKLRRHTEREGPSQKGHDKAEAMGSGIGQPHNVRCATDERSPPTPPSWSRTDQPSACRADSGGRDWPALGPAVWRRSVTASAACIPCLVAACAMLPMHKGRNTEAVMPRSLMVQVPRTCQATPNDGTRATPGMTERYQDDNILKLVISPTCTHHAAIHPTLRRR